MNSVTLDWENKKCNGKIYSFVRNVLQMYCFLHDKLNCRDKLTASSEQSSVQHLIWGSAATSQGSSGCEAEGEEEGEEEAMHWQGSW